MSTAYWAQWSHSEIMSMHGVELHSLHEEDLDFDCYEDKSDEENDDDYDRCPRCSGAGCNYCLMVEW